MPFVKLDCGILNSTLWFEREAREVFLTALLMAEPFETHTPLPQIAIDSLELTGWSVPPGWYGFVPAASVGIIHRAKVSEAAGLQALQRLGSPEDTSRSKDFDGRRLVRVDGGFIVLNFMKYRDRDYSAAERQRRYRKRLALRRENVASHRNITQAEAEAEVEVQKKNKSAHIDRQPVQGSGAFEPGSLPRDHMRHALCGPAMKICLKEWEYTTLAKALNTPDAGEARAVLARFLEQLEGAVGAQNPIGPFTWIEKQFHAYLKSIGKVAPTLKPKPRGVAEILAEKAK